MQSYYYLFIIMILSVIIFIVRTSVLRKRNIPVELFVEALRNENSGHFEEARITYENALNEVEKNRFHDASLKNRIVEKIKVLHTLIEYKNNLHVIR